jgi:protein-disulfide isomerase
MRRAAAVSLALLCAAGPAAAGWLSPAERQAFRAELRAYLLDHPEVIEEALSGAEARRQQRHAETDLARLDAHADELFHAAADWTGGNPEGSTNVVSFIGYGCESCERALAAVRELARQDPDVRLIVKDVAAPDDAEGARAARFAQAVLHLAGAAAYETAQAALFAAPDFSAATLTVIASGLGLDAEAVTVAMDGPEPGATVAANMALTAALDLGPAPAHVLDRIMVQGDVPAVALARMLDSTRRKK